MKSNIKWYGSVAEYVESLKPEYSIYERELHWLGGCAFKEYCAYFKAGAGDSETCGAKKLVNKIDASFRDREVLQWMPSVQGAYPIVPEYLAGFHECMRAKRAVGSDIAPIKVMLCTNVASGVTHTTMARRAAAYAAFVMRLSETRPVELYAVSLFHHRNKCVDVGAVVKLDATPIDLSQIIAAFNPSVARGCTFTKLGELAGDTERESYPFELKGVSAYKDRKGYVKAAREYLGLVESDVMLDSGILTDVNAIDADPVAWVHKQLEKQRELI